MKKGSLLILLCLGLVLSTATGLAETMFVVTTHGDDFVNMYTEPDYSAGAIVISIPSGAEVAVRTVMADVPWAEVSYGGYTGYIALENLSQTRPGSGTPYIPSGPVIKTMYVTSHDGDGVHMRTAPTINDDNIIMTVPYGEPVGVITIMADVPWAAIEYGGQVGYMMMDYLSNHAPEPRQAPSSEAESTENGTSMAAIFAGFQPHGYRAVVVPAQGETYVNMRWAPTLSAPVRVEYKADVTLWVSSENGTWSEVYDEALGIHGYMESVFLAQQ